VSGRISQKVKNLQGCQRTFHIGCTSLVVLAFCSFLFFPPKRVAFSALHSFFLYGRYPLTPLYHYIKMLFLVKLKDPHRVVGHIISRKNKIEDVMQAINFHVFSS